jgi:hypothetical protein
VGGKEPDAAVVGRGRAGLHGEGQECIVGKVMHPWRRLTLPAGLAAMSGFVQLERKSIGEPDRSVTW